MTPEALDQLADAVSRTLSAHVGDRCGYVLILTAGDHIIYRSDMTDAYAAGVLDDCADHMRSGPVDDTLTD